MIDLHKAAENLKLDLTKKGVHTPPEAEVAFILDVSGSFTGEHEDGTTQKLLERLVPWALVLDPDKKLDVFSFASGSLSAHHVGTLTAETCDGYVRREIVGRVPNYGGGTDYGYVLEKALKHFGWVKKGFFDRLVNGTSEKRRSVVFFVTDGDNSDKSEAYRVLKESEERKDGVYFMFLGVGHSSFPFIEKLGEDFSNVGFLKVGNIRSFAALSDSELNDKIIGGEDEELVKWLKA